MHPFSLSVGSLHCYHVSRAAFDQHLPRNIIKTKMEGNLACKLLLLYSMQPFTGLSHHTKALRDDSNNSCIGD